jgi:sulfur relay (sulfurtransferase) DsrC/TusE family protein
LIENKQIISMKFSMRLTFLTCSKHFYHHSLFSESPDWNEKFQKSVEKILKDKLNENYQELSQLVRDFVEAAKVTSEQMIPT